MIQRSTGMLVSSQGVCVCGERERELTFDTLTQSSVLSYTHTHTHTHTYTWHNTITHSDPQSVASLLVQQLLSQFSKTFLANNGSSTVSTDASLGGVGGERKESCAPHRSVKEFLCQDTTLLLMLAIQLVGQKVRVHYALGVLS